MVEHELPKLRARVRFSSPAPYESPRPMAGAFLLSGPDCSLRARCVPDLAGGSLCSLALAAWVGGGWRQCGRPLTTFRERTWMSGGCAAGAGCGGRGRASRHVRGTSGRAPSRRDSSRLRRSAGRDELRRRASLRRPRGCGARTARRDVAHPGLAVGASCCADWRDVARLTPFPSPTRNAPPAPDAALLRDRCAGPCFGVRWARELGSRGCVAVGDAGWMCVPVSARFTVPLGGFPPCPWPCSLWPSSPSG